jgi:hypothetical protein
MPENEWEGPPMSSATWPSDKRRRPTTSMHEDDAEQSQRKHEHERNDS